MIGVLITGRLFEVQTPPFNNSLYSSLFPIVTKGFDTYFEPNTQKWPIHNTKPTITYSQPEAHLTKHLLMISKLGIREWINRTHFGHGQALKNRSCLAIACSQAFSKNRL